MSKARTTAQRMVDAALGELRAAEEERARNPKPLTDAERRLVEEHRALLAAVDEEMRRNPRPPSPEDEHMRRKMQSGGPVVIKPKK